MREHNGDDAAARLVSKHLHGLLAEARREGLSLEELTIELAAHATCAALSFWSADELRQLIEAAEDDEVSNSDDLSHMAAVGAA